MLLEGPDGWTREVALYGFPPIEEEEYVAGTYTTWLDEYHGDEFGAAVGLSSDWLLVGAPGHAVGLATGQGAVFAYRLGDAALGESCENQLDCLSGHCEDEMCCVDRCGWREECVEGACTGLPVLDSGMPDSRLPDAGMDASLDAADTRDAGGDPDSGRADSGRADSGRPDSRAPDAGRPDSGLSDSGADTPPSPRDGSAVSAAGAPDSGSEARHVRYGCSAVRSESAPQWWFYLLGAICCIRRRRPVRPRSTAEVER